MAEQSLTGEQLIFILLFFLLLLGFWEGMLSTGRTEEMQEPWWPLPPPTPTPAPQLNLPCVSWSLRQTEEMGRGHLFSKQESLDGRLVRLSSYPHGPVPL